jgi:hypothetical protein
MDFDPTRVLYDHFIPNDQTFWQAAKCDSRRARRILHYTIMYKKRFPQRNIRRCVSDAMKLVDAMRIIELWNRTNPDLPI